MSGFDNYLRGETETAWKVKEHDEEKYNFSDEKGLWQPRPEDILSMFEKLAQGKQLPLKWSCPGRRPPDTNLKSDKGAEDGESIDGDDSKDEELKAPETSTFDFDEPHIDVNAKLIPKRTPGGPGRIPKTEKRVARMDNIMKSLQKQQLQRVAEREARKNKGSPSASPSRPRLLNFGSDSSKKVTGASMTPSSHNSPTSSPRFAGSSPASNSSTTLNRSLMFMTPTNSARKMASKFGTNNATTSEASGVHPNTFTNAQQGLPFDSSENRSEQAVTAADLAESVVSTGGFPSITLPPKNSYISSPFFNHPVTNNSTKANTSVPFVSSTVSNTSNTASRIISNSPVTSLDKEFVNTTDSISGESNQQFASISSRMSVSTAMTTTSATSAAITTLTSETHPASSTGVPSSPTFHVNHPSSAINLESIASDTSVQDPLSNFTESVTLSAGVVNPDGHNSNSTNWKLPSSSGK